MKKNFNNLREEMNRMKSLFTEERLFGNLIIEQEEEETEEEETEEEETEEEADPAPGTDADKDKQGVEFKDKSDTSVKKDFKDKKPETLYNQKECKNHVLEMIKEVRSGKNREYYDKKEPNSINTLQYCIRTFEQTWRNPVDGKWFWQKADELRILYNTLNLKMPVWLSDRIKDKKEQEISSDVYDPEGGVTGGSGAKKIIVRHKNKYKIAIINKKGDNLWSFRTPIKLKNMIPLVDKKDLGNIKFRQKYVNDIYKSLNIDPNKYRIVIQKAFESKGFDAGTFVLKKK